MKWLSDSRYPFSHCSDSQSSTLPNTLCLTFVIEDLVQSGGCQAPPLGKYNSPLETVVMTAAERYRVVLGGVKQGPVWAPRGHEEGERV